MEDEQEQFFPEMMSARGTSSCRDDERTDMDKKQKLIYCSLQASGQDADVDAGLNVALRVLDIQKVKSNELARNKKYRDEVFRIHITACCNQYLELLEQEKQAKGQQYK